MGEVVKGKRILILSPQPWDHHLISKHHYARAFAKNNKVLFVTPPFVGFTRPGYHIFQPDARLLELSVLTLHLFYPNRFRFYFPNTFRWLYEWRLSRWLNRNFKNIDLIIDFGCYNQLKSLTNLRANKKIFFPVDDAETMKPESRGSDLMLTVSTSIQKKFTDKGLAMKFINHGLADDFVWRAENNLANNEVIPIKQSVSGLRVGYSGNLFIRFLDRPVLKRCIEEYRDIEFHFFGSIKPMNSNDQEWLDYLTHQENVILEGQKETTELSEALENMDVLLICYKPDYKNYHGENTHKMLEYLSTGRMVISTFISYYQQREFLMMTKKDQNDGIVSLLNVVRDNQSLLYNAARAKEQVRFALANSYDIRCQEIFELIGD